MRRTIVFAAMLATGLAGVAAAQQAMQIFPSGSRPSAKGPEAYFTGSVRVDPQFAAPDQTSLSAGHVTFEPGARSAWHSHPAGQLLIITSGKGWVQEANGAKREVNVGDVIWTPPSVKHWHGATDGNAMSHYAIQESVNGKNVEWMEKVTDDQYTR